MDGLAATTSITSFNGVEDLRGLFEGGLAQAALSGKRMGRMAETGDWGASVVVSRLLLRSEGTLKRLDLRWVRVFMARG